MVLEERDKDPESVTWGSPGVHGTQPEAVPALAPGALLAGRYEIVRFIARGGMGDVYEAEDRELGGRLALKTLRAGVATSDKALERFKREIALARKVTHPNVCRIFDAGFHKPGEGGPGEPGFSMTFLTMELLQGETLADRLQARGNLRPEEALPIVRQAAAALEAAHEAGVVHRDLKCGNIMLVPSAEGERVVITDFGLARATTPGDSEGSTLTATGAIFGTPAYMAPEQLQGGLVTPATDVYAFGIILFEMVTGALPFRADTAITAAVKRLTEPPPSPRTLAPDLDPRWEATILKCLQKDPAQRFQNAREIVEALEGRLPVRYARPWKKIAAAAAGVLLLAAVAALSVYLAKRPRQPPAQAPATAVKARKTVAVLWFKNLTGRPGSAWLSTALAEMMSTELAAGGAVRAIPGENVARMRAELALSEAPALAADTLRKVRESLGTDYVVLGSYAALGPEMGGRLRLDIIVQDARTGETLAAITGSGTEDRLFDVVTSAGNQLREKLGASVTSREDAVQARATMPADPRAAELYARGIEALRRFEASEAKESLEKAAQIEPGHPMIHLALSKAWTDLGYDVRSREEAKKAFDLSGGLSRENRLLIEAKYHFAAKRWDRAEELSRSLFTFYPDNLEYGLDLAQAQSRGGRRKEALGTLALLKALPPPSGTDLRIGLSEAYAVGYLSDFERSAAIARRTGAEAGRLGMVSMEARAKRIEGWALRRMGRMDEAMAACEESRALHRKLGDKTGEAGAIHTMANILHAQGKLPESLVKYQSAYDTFRQCGFVAGMCWSLNDMADVYYAQGDLEGARKNFEQALALGREIDDKSTMATVSGNLASLLLLRGDVAGAERLVAECLALCDETGEREMKVNALATSAEIRLVRGDLDGARAGFEESLALGLQISSGTETPLVQVALGTLLLEQGHAAAGQAMAAKALEGLDKEGADCRKVGAASLLARALLAEGRLEEARAAAERARALDRGCGAGLERLKYTMTRAEVLAASGRPQDALAGLRAALAEAERMGDVKDRLEILLALGRIEVASGRAAEGKARLAALEKEAGRRGFLLVAKKASAAISQSP